MSNRNKAHQLIRNYVPIAVAALLFLPVCRSKAQENSGTVSVLPKSSVRYAVLVGVENYDDPNISSLIGPANDVTLLKSNLEKYAGFTEDNIAVLSTANGNRKPTKEEILVALSRIRGLVPEDGLLLFMFSGHGISRGDKAFLLPSNARLTSDVDLLEDTALSVDLVRTRIAGTKVKQAIVLLDACRDDPERSKSVGGTNPLTKQFTDGFDFATYNKQIEASAVIYATSIGNRAYIDSNSKEGYFTEAITDGLSGKAAASNGAITLSSLLDYVQTTVPKMVARDLGADKNQKPIYVLSGYLPSQLVLAHTSLLTANTMIPAQPTPSSGAEKAPDPRSPRSGALDFGAQFEKNRTDEQALSELGEAAFTRGNYDWTIKYLEQAKAIQSSKVWMSSYPFLAAAYLLSESNERKFKATLDEMTRQMQVPNTYLHHPIAISFCISNLVKIRAVIPQGDVGIVDLTIDEATRISASLSAPQHESAISVCHFYGEANQGQSAFLKEESCIIPDIDHLDRTYHQASFVCCGGGASSPTTASDIPAGIEIKTSGGHFWSVQTPKLVSDKFSITTYCGPSGGAEGGCNVKTEVVAHYKF